MTSVWQDFLIECGARITADAVSDFGDAAAELRAARDASVVCPLMHLGLMACDGDDAQAFLHGQLSNDVKILAPECSEYAAYCTAKGRMLANFLLWRDDRTYFLQLARSLLPAIQKRLTMYVMRSKVKLSDAGESYVVLGLAGKAAANALRALFPVIPQQAHEVVHDPLHGTLIALPGSRFQLVAKAETAAHLWRELTVTLTAVGTPCWEWLEIRNGIPLLTPPTQEQFVPQMANMELLGAVNFKKGCYPGQEIIARTQHLGEIKRRMALAHVAGPMMPQPGDALFGAAADEPAIGMVVNAQVAPEGGYDLLAVLHVGSADAGDVHLMSVDGPVLSMQNLPYTV